MRTGEASSPPSADAALAAVLFAVDPAGLAGVSVRSPAGPARDRWLTLLRGLLPPGSSVRRVPLHVPDERLLGGLDLAATLRAGCRVAQRGILPEADGGVVLLAMAERLAPATAARLGAVLDTGEVALERDGIGLRLPARIGVVALDEGIGDDEQPPAALLDRLAFRVDLGAVASSDAPRTAHGASKVAAARARLPDVGVGGAVLDALCAAAAALGVASLRAPLLALRAARASAALAGRGVVSDEDAALAARLVLAPRATVVPVPETPVPEAQGGEDREDPAEHEAEPSSQEADERDGEGEDRLSEIVLAAAQAAIPSDMLSWLQVVGGRSRGRAAGPAGQRQAAAVRGRPVGVRAGELRSGGRLSLVETLRAAAPRQRLRRREDLGVRVAVLPEDFRFTRFEQRARTTTIFVVDASGSSALHRLAEAKGAVELCLAECYVRRDRVALIAFRGRGAELLLPPTSSLARVRRSLSGLPGGGGTPLAAGIGAAATLAEEIRRKGETPAVILLTDGRANVARDGSAGRPRAEAEAVEAARLVRSARLSSLLVDIAPRPQPLARQIADAMGAHYLPLPQADAEALSQAARIAAQGGIRSGA